MHTLHGCRGLHLESLETIELSELLVSKNEWTDSSVRTDVSTLVTLDTVVLVPSPKHSVVSWSLPSKQERRPPHRASRKQRYGHHVLIGSQCTCLVTLAGNLFSVYRGKIDIISETSIFSSSECIENYIFFADFRLKGTFSLSHEQKACFLSRRENEG